MNRTPNAFDTDETAAAWLVRLDADTSEVTRASWQQWLREDARNHAAFARVEKGWRQAECLKSLRPLDGAVRADLLDAFPEMERSVGGGRRKRGARPRNIFPGPPPRRREGRSARPTR